MPPPPGCRPTARSGGAGPRRLVVLAGLAATLLLAAACTDQLAEQASTPGDGVGGVDRAVDSAVCALVREGIDAYNTGDLEASTRAFDDALPLARARADRIASGQQGRRATELLAAVRYYEGLSVAQLREAFPATPETLPYQVTTLGQCRPGGADDPGPDEVPA